MQANFAIDIQQLRYSLLHVELFIQALDVAYVAFGFDFRAPDSLCDGTDYVRATWESGPDNDIISVVFFYF